jgi:hypothetical protein
MASEFNKSAEDNRSEKEACYSLHLPKTGNYWSARKRWEPERYNE